jgi:hypothetical protein
MDEKTFAPRLIRSPRKAAASIEPLTLGDRVSPF